MIKKLIPLLGALLLPAFAASAATLTDAEILHVLHTANTAEIQAAELAETKASSKDVKDYATAMIKDHQTMDKGGEDLAKKLKLTPADNALSKSLKSSGDAEMTALKAAASGDAFNKAYADGAVKDHEAVLAAIDNDLLPNAKNAEIKSMLTSARPKIQSHLDHAKKLQATLKSAH